MHVYIYMVITYNTREQSIDQPSKVANPARGQLIRIFFFPLYLLMPEIWSPEADSVVPSRVTLLILHDN